MFANVGGFYAWISCPVAVLKKKYPERKRKKKKTNRLLGNTSKLVGEFQWLFATFCEWLSVIQGVFTHKKSRKVTKTRQLILTCSQPTGLVNERGSLFGNYIVLLLYYAGFDAWVMLIHARDKNDVHCNIATLYIAPRFPEHRKFCVF